MSEGTTAATLRLLREEWEAPLRVQLEAMTTERNMWRGACKKAQAETLTEIEQKLWGTEQALEGACRNYEAARADAAYVRARAKDALEEKQRELEDLHDGMERLRAVAEAAELLMQGMVGDDRHRVNTLRLALQAAGYLKEKAE